MTETRVPIRHIVFDIGSVLIHYDPHIAYKPLIPDDAARHEFLDTVCTSSWNIEQDRGRTWEEAEAILIAEHPDKAPLIRAFRQNWHQMVSHAYEDSVTIMLDLIDNGHDVTMLTNFASDTFRQAQEMYPFLKAPRGVTVSGDVKMLKPERGIYERHTADFDLDPGSCLFIDDVAKNVQGARDAGWHAIRFINAEQLRNDLAGYELERPQG